MCLVNKQLYNKDTKTETPTEDINLYLLVTILLIRITTGDTNILARIFDIIVRKKQYEINSILNICKTIYTELNIPAPLGIASTINNFCRYHESLYSIIKI